MLLGYATTAAVLATFASLLLFVFMGRKELREVLSKCRNRYSLIALLAILVYLFALPFVFILGAGLIAFFQKLLRYHMIRFITCC